MKSPEELSRNAIASMSKAMERFPQPNYVAAKVAEESGEAIRAYIHMAEGRGSWEEFEAEIIDAMAMLFRLYYEGDQTINRNVL